MNLRSLDPSETTLRDWVRPRLDAALVRDMVVHDHGMRVDEHRLAIPAWKTLAEHAGKAWSEVSSLR